MPSGQAVQVLDVALEMVPAGHMWHSIPLSEYLPAIHVRHLLESILE